MSNKETDIKLEHNAVLQPRGEHEKMMNFLLRCHAQQYCSYSIPPREAQESSLSFATRMMLSASQ